MLSNIIASVLFITLIVYLIRKNNTPADPDRKNTFRKRTVILDEVLVHGGKKYVVKAEIFESYFSSMTQVLVGTPGALPNIYLDSKNYMKGTYRNKFRMNMTKKRHSLEGDFDSYFTAHTPDGFKVEALQFLTPDIMQYFKDNFSDYDISIYGGTIDMRKSGKESSANLQKQYPHLVKKIARFYKWWSTQDKIDSLANNLERMNNNL